MTTTRVVVAGGGAREHAIAWSVKGERDDVEVICAPGNAGTETIATNVPVKSAADVATLARDREADLVIIGPDALVADGLANMCAEHGIPVFGATREAGRVESSKSFAKRLMDDANIPTARWVAGGREQRSELLEFIRELNGECAVKADGLALGKGVVVCDSLETADRAVTECLDAGRFGAAGMNVVVEERLRGVEASVLAFTDGRQVRVLVPSRDYKAAHDGGVGPNTGGMGAVAPVPDIDALGLAEEASRRVLQPCVDTLRERGTPFVGCLYAGLMLTDRGIRVLEFNARLGDPEAQVVLPLLAEPALELFRQCANGTLAAGATWRDGVCVGVVAASAGYPGDNVDLGKPIGGLEQLDDGVLCFHAGTRREGSDVVTSGGRVLTVVGRAGDVPTAREIAYRNLERLHYDGMWSRRDIASPVGVAA